jgi:protein-S-isoprenylcysteine O-methyltransferase Ste14
MRSLAFVWPYAAAFWAVYIWAFWPEMRIVRQGQKSVKQNKATDSGSLQVILFGMQVGILLAFATAFVPWLMFPRAAIVPALWSGIAVLIAGSLLRRHCWRVLGQYFTGDVQVQNDQPVIMRGAYKWVRHPSYTGGILMLTGIGIALANWASLAILVATAIAVYSYRVHAEERALVQTLGDPYVAYMKTHERFIPFVI